MKSKIQAETAYTFIRGQLLAGNFEAGARLTEEPLCSAAGVNRGDIRQAFSRLLAEGLVVRGKKGGVFVPEYTDEDLAETYEVRQILEIAAARLAVDRADEHDFAALEETARHMLLMAENGYRLGLCESDLRFHTLLVKAAHNEKLYELYMRANIPLSGLDHIWKEKRKDEVDLFADVQDHLQMVEFLKAGEIEPLLALLTKWRPVA